MKSELYKYLSGTSIEGPAPQKGHPMRVQRGALQHADVDGVHVLDSDDVPLEACTI